MLQTLYTFNLSGNFSKLVASIVDARRQGGVVTDPTLDITQISCLGTMVMKNAFWQKQYLHPLTFGKMSANSLLAYKIFGETYKFVKILA